jgi:hypothetical protein
VLIPMHSDCTPLPVPEVYFGFFLFLHLWIGLIGRFRDRPEVFVNQARQCAILSTSSAMLYDTPGQEDEDSALRFGKITKDEYADVLRIAEGMWKRKQEGEQTSQIKLT